VSIFASDTFTGTAGTDLASHAGELGASWTKHGFNSGLGAAALNSNNLRASSDNGTVIYYTSGTPSGAEYDVEATLAPGTDMANSAWQGGVAGRIDTAANTFYLGAYSNNFTGGSNNYFLHKRVAGALTVLGTFNATLSASTALKLEIRNAAKKVYVGGTERISSTDNAITSAGKAGVYQSATTAFSGVGQGAGRGVLIDTFVATDTSTVISRTATDSVGTSESITTTPSTGRTVTESVSTSEALAYTRLWVISAGDALTVREDDETTIGFLLALQRPANTPTAEVFRGRSVTDSAGVSDSVTASIQRTAAITDAVGATDAAARAPAFLARPVLESLGVAETANHGNSNSFWVSESLSLTEAVSRTRIVTRPATDLIVLLDSPAARRQFSRGLSEGVMVFDRLPGPNGIELPTYVSLPDADYFSVVAIPGQPYRAEVIVLD
jgi:hypothetical protein